MDNLDKVRVSRRDFLKISLLAYLKAQNPSLDFEKQEQVLSLIHLINRGKYLHIPSTQGIFQLEEVNNEWENYESIDIKTPGISQGVATLFGVNAVARGQLLVRTDEIRRKLSNSERLTRSEMFLLSIRNYYDRTIDESIVDINSMEYVQLFNELLANFGIDGVVALKSAQDFGDIGKIALYNHVLERWVGYYNVIVLNTAEPTTFFRNRGVTSILNGTSTELAWLGDVSSELVERSGLSLDPEHRTATPIRWYRNDLTELVDGSLERISIPEIQRSDLGNLNTSSREFSLLLSDTLSNANPEEILEFYNLVVQNQDLTFNPEFVNIGAYPQNARSFFIAYIIHSIGIPIFADSSIADLQDMILNPLDTRSIGFPLSSGSIYNFIQNFYGNFVLDRIIFSPIYPETDFSNINNAIFFVEDVRNPYTNTGVVKLKEGVMITINDQKRFLFIDENGDFQNSSLSELSERYLNQPTFRLSVYF